MNRDTAFLLDIANAAEAIVRFVGGKGIGEFTEDDLLQSAVQHQLIILGEATKRLSVEFRSAAPHIPWKLMAGMRDRITHGYFEVDLHEVWKTPVQDIPILLKAIEIAALAEGADGFSDLNRNLGAPSGTGEMAPDGTPWRPCRAGEYWRRGHYQSTYKKTDGTLVRGHTVRSGCCNNPSKKDQIYSEELKLIAKNHFGRLAGPPSPDDLGFGRKGKQFDDIVRGWTLFWNAILNPPDPLDPNLVKALIASESSFDSKPRVGGAKARGLMQVTDGTRKILGDSKGELRDHLVHVDQKDITDPLLNVAAGTRWLFQKKYLAGIRLKRTATWDDAIAEYKDYLRKMIKDPEHVPTGMQKFRDFYRTLSGK